MLNRNTSNSNSLIPDTQDFDAQRPRSSNVALLCLTVLVSVVGLALIWEFFLEFPILSQFGLQEEDEGNAERWNYMATITVCTGLALILPAILLRRHEEARRENADRFRAILDSPTNIMIISVDQSGSVISWNPAAERIFGYRKSEILGHPLTAIIPERYRSDHMKGLTRAETSDDYRIVGKTVEVHGLKKNHEEFPMELTVGVWKQSGKKFFSAICLDISERKRAEALLLEAKVEAELANKVKSEFLSSMSHELRTPLNAVLGYAQILQFDPKNPLSPTQKEHVDSIIDGGDRLLGLVKQILDLTRIEADQLALSLSDINVNHVIAECVALTAPLGQSRAISFTDQFSGEPSQQVFGDRMLLKQITLNLLSNAVKFNKDGGQVVISGQTTDDHFLRLSVADTGIGIADEISSQLFQMFHHMDVNSSIAKKGAGIGLTVTKLLVERMAGRIGFVSTQGQGSTFWIELPLISNREILIWSDAVRVGVDAIDKDHQMLISLMNRLSHRSVDPSELDANIEKLIDDSRYAFRREEMIMSICDCPNQEAHRTQHREFTTLMTGFANAWRRDPSPENLLTFRRYVRDWWLDHITTMDIDITPHTKGKDQKIRNLLDPLD